MLGGGTFSFERVCKGLEPSKGTRDCEMKRFQARTEKYACVAQGHPAVILVEREFREIL